MSFFVILFSGIISTFLMIIFLELVTRTKFANADMVRAIGSMITRSYDTFVYEGPIFNKNINKKLGEIVLRDERFYYCDILPI